MPDSREIKDKPVKPRASARPVNLVEASLRAIFIVVGLSAGASALGLYMQDLTKDTQDRLSPDISDAALYLYPNSFDMQYVFPDWQRRGLNPEVLYNVAIDLHSKSFSAHVPIKSHAELQFIKSSVPRYYAIPDAMYVYFTGSHNIPKEPTGLGSGSVHGYIVANKTFDDNTEIRYEGNAILQYEMSGEFPIYVTSISPSIERYDPSLKENSPTITIASEEATNAYFQQQEAAKTERHQMISTLAIIFASFLIAIPAIPHIAQAIYPVNTRENKNGQSTNSDKPSTS